MGVGFRSLWNRESRDGTLAGDPTILRWTEDTDERPMSEKRFEERTRWVYDEQAFPVWNGSFAKPERTEMIQDDLWAGRSIAILLATLVAIGLVLAVSTVAFVMNWR